MLNSKIDKSNLLLMAAHTVADFNLANISTLEAKVFRFRVLLTLTGCGDCRRFPGTPNHYDLEYIPSILS